VMVALATLYGYVHIEAKREIHGAMHISIQGWLGYNNVFCSLSLIFC